MANRKNQILHMKKLILLTAPSGAGKSTIAHYLIKNNDKYLFSISAATRTPRGSERNGIDYYFMSEKDFIEKIKKEAFVEWEMVYEGKYYGTLKSELERIWNKNKIPILDIDVKGAIHVKRLYGPQCLTIFIMPPSIEDLRKRLELRNTDTSDNIETRINKASYEISFKDSFDKVIVNDNINKACEEAKKIIDEFIAD